MSEQRWKQVCSTCRIGCKEVEKLLDEPGLRQVACPEWSGLLIFTKLPEDYRPANAYDLFVNMHVRVGTQCLLKSFYGNNYQNFTIKFNTDREWLLKFLNEGHCFVKK